MTSGLDQAVLVEEIKEQVIKQIAEEEEPVITGDVNPEEQQQPAKDFEQPSQEPIE